MGYFTNQRRSAIINLIWLSCHSGIKSRINRAIGLILSLVFNLGQVWAWDSRAGNYKRQKMREELKWKQ